MFIIKSEKYSYQIQHIFKDNIVYIIDQFKDSIVCIRKVVYIIDLNNKVQIKLPCHSKSSKLANHGYMPKVQIATKYWIHELFIS